MKEKITFETKKAKEYFLNKISFSTGPFELSDMINNSIEKINIIDVRKYDDYIDGHIPYAIHVPYESLDEHFKMFEKDKVNIIYCYNTFCKLADKTAYRASDKGYPVMVLAGGYHIWQKLGYETVKTSSEYDK